MKYEYVILGKSAEGMWKDFASDFTNKNPLPHTLSVIKKYFILI